MVPRSTIASMITQRTLYDLGRVYSLIYTRYSGSLHRLADIHFVLCYDQMSLPAVAGV